MQTQDGFLPALLGEIKEKLGNAEKKYKDFKHRKWNVHPLLMHSYKFTSLHKIMGHARHQKLRLGERSRSGCIACPTK
jgi:hypothetical protein